jgi:hypothetical protein
MSCPLIDGDPNPIPPNGTVIFHLLTVAVRKVENPANGGTEGDLQIGFLSEPQKMVRPPKMTLNAIATPFLTVQKVMKNIMNETCPSSKSDESISKKKDDREKR